MSCAQIGVRGPVAVTESRLEPLGRASEHYDMSKQHSYAYAADAEWV
jgi:hypothetical protein